jgi:hypothetical protein
VYRSPRILSHFEIFNEAIKARDMSSIPPGYLDHISNRAKERLGISGGNQDPSPDAQRCFARSRDLSRGHERELENLAKEVITNLYKPLLDYYNIKLVIKISDGQSIKQMMSSSFAKTRSQNTPKPDSNPVIKAMGSDFGMLIHEAVKGIWRVMSMSAVPSDPVLAKAIEDQFGLEDEPDEWKYGPEMARDLKDFIFINPKVLEFKNLREELWNYMVDPDNLPTEEFLPLMTGIFKKTDEARKKVDELIDLVIEKIKRRDAWLEQERLNQEEYERKMQAWKARQLAKDPDRSEYEFMTQEELVKELQKASGEGDFEKMIKIGEFLK